MPMRKYADIDITDAKDYPSYFNYRVILKAKEEGYIKKTSNHNDNYNHYDTAGDNLKNSECYRKFGGAVEGEISILNKYLIKPVKTTCLIKNYGKNSFRPALPQFLHIYDPYNTFATSAVNIKSGKGIFLTSSRFKDAKIYKPDNAALKDFRDYYINLNCNDNVKADFICIGTNSEAELEFIEKYDKTSLLIILPHYPLLNFNAANKLMPAASPASADYKNIMQIYAIDPFCKTSKYGFSVRNNLAFHLSGEMAIFYLSKKSSLLSIIKKFKSAGKPVKIFEGGQYLENNDNNLIESNKNQAKTETEYNAVQKFILKTLEKENITIDNLIKLSNIKFNINSNEILKNISMLEINSEIERFPGGIIKKTL